MRRSSLLLSLGLAMALSVPAWAGTDDDDSGPPSGGQPVGSGASTKCKPVGDASADCKQVPSLHQDLKNVTEKVNESEGGLRGGQCHAVIQSEVPQLSSVPACHDFFCHSESEPCGQFGQFVYKAIRDHFGNDSSFMRGTTDMDRVCPGFDHFNEDQKLNFWVYVMAGIADGELDCSKSEKLAHIVNGLGVGPFQMEFERRRRSWRGGFCTAKSVRNWRNNTLCALTILNDQLVPGGKYGGNGSLFQPGKGYWEVLRPGGNRYSVTSQVIAHIPGCGHQTVPTVTRHHKRKKRHSAKKRKH